MDRSGSLLKTPRVDAAALGMPLMEFDKYVKTRNIFDTSFSAERVRYPNWAGTSASARTSV